MQLKKTVIAVAAMATALSLAACGGDGGGGGGNDPAGNESAAPGGGAGAGKNPTLEGPLEVPEDAADGGTITVLASVAPATFDPTRSYYVDSTAVLDLVTRSLTQYAYNEETGDMELVPDLATDLGRPNEDNTEWTFTLKDGIKYEDGTEVTAEDVAYAVKRSFALDELPDGPVYQTQYFLDGDTYKGPFKPGGEDYAGVEVNGNDITIKMATPFPEMDFYASFPLFTPIPEAKDDPETYGNKPLATGPYKFESYNPGTSLTLVKNDQWDPNTDPGRIQTVDRWEFKFGEDTTQLENTIRSDSGAGQTTVNYENIQANTLRAFEQEAPERLTLGTTPCTRMWYFDMRKITDINVRKAIALAYPVKEAYKAAGITLGKSRTPGTTILPPGTAGRVEYDVLGDGGLGGNPDAARKLLEESGNEGFEVKWNYSSDDPIAVDVMEAVSEGLEAAGFVASPIASTTTTIRDDLNDPNSEANVRSQGWCSDWPSGGSWFPAQWVGAAITPDSVNNPSFLDEEDINAEVKRIQEEESAENAPSAWGELDKTIMEKYFPAAILGYDGLAVIRGSKIGGFNADTTKGMPTFKIMYTTE
jgi:peptide/nickel transport system substrate-binding protein